MPTCVWNAIYLGNFDSFATGREAGDLAENCTALLGNIYGSDKTPLADNRIAVTASKMGGYWDTMDFEGTILNGSLTYDLGSGSQTRTFDTLIKYKAALTYCDGSQATINSGIAQDASGNLFLIPQTSVSATGAKPDGSKPIQTLRILQVIGKGGTAIHNAKSDARLACFARGSLIDTPDGPRPVEDLSEGDLLETKDHGAQPIAWRSRRKVLARGCGRAYRINVGVLGNGTPTQDLVLPAQHRIMLRSPIAARLVGSTEVLVPITKLDALPGINLAEDLGEIEYHHIMCDRHELVRANGSWCETMLPDPQVAQMLGPDALAQIEKRVPAWRDMQAVRPSLEGKRKRQEKPPVQSRGPNPISDAGLRTARG